MSQKDLFQAPREGQDAGDTVLFGCSAFSKSDWVGPFYPKGTKPGDYLSWYASRFRTVEIDSTYYAVPSPSTVEGWLAKTPDDFTFAAKFPRQIVHGGEGAKPDPDAILDSNIAKATTEAFLSAIARLQHKLGSLLIQFPYFNRSAFAEPGPFLERLDRYLASLPTEETRFAVEIRNKAWLTREFADLVRGHGCAIALVDHAWMPHGAELAARFDPLAEGFGYVRLVGDRAKIEKMTQSWDREVIDRSESLSRWAALLVELQERAKRVFVYVNDHFSGYAVGAVGNLMLMYTKMLREAWGKDDEDNS